MRLSFPSKLYPAVFLTLLSLFPYTYCAGADLQAIPSAPATSGADSSQSEIEQYPTVISVPNVDDGGFYNRDVTPRINIKSPRLKTMSITVDDRPYSPDTPIETEGLHRLRVTAEDRSGNRSSFQVTFTIDKTPPATELKPTAFLKDDNGSIFVTGSSGIAVTGEDKGISPSGIAAIQCRLDGGDLELYTKPYSMSGLSDGTHTVYCQSSDRAGNREPEQKLTVTVSNSPPTTVITLSPPHRSMPDGSYMASPTTVLNLFASGSPSGIAKTEYQVDEGAWQNAAPFTIGSEGSHTIRFRSTDKLGNKETPKILSVFIDKKPPLTRLEIAGDFAGSDKSLFASPAARFVITANSPVIGILKSEYRVDNRQWTDYVKPFSLETEGKHLVEFRSIDAVGNTEPAQTQYVTVDATAPLTSAVIDGHPVPPATTHYTKGNSAITLKAMDKLSGVKATEYRVDAGPWQPYAPFTLDTKKRRRVDFKSIDNVGNVEEINTITIDNDQTPPVSKLLAGIPSTVAEGVLHVTAQTVFTMSADDAASGVAKSEYRIDGGKWQPYAPFRVSAEGTHVIDFRSTDAVGNEEQPKTLRVKTGEGVPRTTVFLAGRKEPVADEVFITGKIPLKLSASSKVWGVKKTEFRIDGSPWTDYTSPIPMEEEGKHLLEYRSIDTAGNMEQIQSVGVTVDKTPPTAALQVGNPKRERDGLIQIEAGTLLTPSATDNLSGVDRIEYQIKGSGIESDGIPFSIATRGKFEIAYWSFDRAGNKSTPQKLFLEVTAAPRQFSPEDLLLSNELSSPPEIVKDKQPPAKASEKVAAVPPEKLPDLPPEEEVVRPPKPEDRSFIYWTLGVLQVGLILAVMLF